jgi:undecaprenyl-diphosphatase
VGLALAVLAARVVYLVWFCPYELAADEAQYWDWSRRLDLSYYSKGPGVAWVIAASTRLLGSSEWAVRLPAAVASAVATLALARLATRLCGGDDRVGFVAALLYQLAPVFYATSQFMTIDAPYFACWVLAAGAGWRVAEGRRRPVDWLLLGFAIGVGLLFKYTILLLVPGVFAYLFRRVPELTVRQKAAGVALAALALLAAASPVLIWNARHGWPTVAHLVGNVGLPGGDVAPRQSWTWNPFWTIGYLLYPLVVLGPAIAAMVLLAFRDRRATEGGGAALAYALYTVTPLAAFYLVVSLATDVELNWAVAGYALLLIPAAEWVVRGRGQAGAGAVWRWTMGLGIACALLISFGKWPLVRASKLEFHGYRLPPIRLLERIDGHRRWAKRVSKFANKVAAEAGQRPFLVGKNHAYAALLAYYMPSKPVVYSAGHLFGGRESAYDYFADTSLADPALLGRPAVMVGAQAWHWSQVMVFDRVERAPVEGRIFAGYEYGGARGKPLVP